MALKAQLEEIRRQTPERKEWSEGLLRLLPMMHEAELRETVRDLAIQFQGAVDAADDMAEMMLDLLNQQARSRLTN